MEGGLSGIFGQVVHKHAKEEAECELGFVLILYQNTVVLTVVGLSPNQNHAF